MGWTWETAFDCTAICFLAFAQSVAFSLVSRARNRNNTAYHIVASIMSNGVWFLTFKSLVTSKMDWMLFVPYTTGTVAGSVFGAKVSQVIEKWLGATSDDHIKPKAQETPKETTQTAAPSK